MRLRSNGLCGSGAVREPELTAGAVFSPAITINLVNKNNDSNPLFRNKRSNLDDVSESSISGVLAESVSDGR